MEGEGKGDGHQYGRKPMTPHIGLLWALSPRIMVMMMNAGVTKQCFFPLIAGEFNFINAASTYTVILSSIPLPLIPIFHQSHFISHGIFSSIPLQFTR